MAAKSSTAPAFIWNWVIETLAKSEQPDVSTLTRLVKIAPAISGDAGKDAREVVYLRILEKLFDHGNEAIDEPDSAQKSKISFDVSERCEDVLKQILHKTPEGITRMEKEKWDIRPFLMHKRSSLPKCSLERLKEGICKSSHPRLASLKESSKVVIANESEDTNPTIQQNKESFLERHLEGSSGNKLNQDNLRHDTELAGHDKLVDNIESLERGDGERTNIAAKKETFLNSRCTLDQDFFAVTELSEIDLCVKCNESGHMLVCSSDTCQLRVHESCLGSAVSLDENGEFFCPFCVYSRAISKYLEAKKKVSLARKDLQAFSSSTVIRTINKSSMEQSDLEKNEGRQTGANIVNCMSNEEESALPKPDVNSEQSLQVTNDLPQNSKPEPNTPKQKCNGNEDRQTGTDNVNYTTNEEDSAVHFPGANSDLSLRQTNDMPQNPKPEPNTVKQKCKEKESRRLTDSPTSRILRKRKAEYDCTTPPVLPLRRKVLPWTKSEEEILKDGVERFSGAIYKGIPWKEILYFGRNVFNKSRTTIDLKDKWRNMCKGSPNVE